MRPVVSWALAAALLLAGCGTTRPPLLGLGDRSCDASPVLQDAVAVPFDTVSGSEIALDGASRCLTTAGGIKVTYAVFRLPDAPAPYAVSITSLEHGTSLFSPRIAVEDASGTVLRILEPGDFRAGIEGLQAGLRTRSGERFLVASADPATLGQARDLRLGLNVAGPRLAMAGPVFIPLLIPIKPKPVTHRITTLSLDGTVRVTAEPITTVP